MSITPLHIGAGYGLRKYISFPAFAATNVLMDVPVIAYLLDEALGDVTPGDSLHALHIPEYAIAVVLVVWALGRTWRVLDAAILGVLSHLLIDAIYHPDVMPEWGIYGVIRQEAMDLLLLTLFLVPVGWECFKRFAAKRTD